MYANHPIKEELIAGERYAFVVSVSKEIFRTTTSAFLAADPAEGWCDVVWHVSGKDGSYLEEDEYAPLRTLTDIINTDVRTFDVVYTTDMSVIRRFADGDMIIREGRALNREDDDNAAPVCVVSKEFSDTNELGVGDTVTIRLGTTLFEQYSSLGALSVIPPRYAPPGKAIELEIVGIYNNTDERSKRNSRPDLNYSINTMFVPGSLLAAGPGQLDDHMFTPAEFNFKIGNVTNIPAFTKECAPIIEGMGLTLTLDDGGWPEIAARFKESERMPLIRMSVFTAAAALSTGFAVYLFIIRKKAEYSVMRALGVTKKTSALALAAPLLLVTAASALIGAAGAWVFVTGNIERSELLLSLRQSAVNASIPAAIVLGCACGEILLTLLFATVFLLRLGATPPLLLLQSSDKTLQLGIGNAEAGFRGAGISSLSPRQLLTSPLEALAGSVSVSFSVSASTTASANTVRRRHAFIMRYIWLHLRRAAGKSVLVVLLATILLAVVGRFAFIRRSYTDLIETSGIVVRALGGARLSLVPRIMDSGYIKESYYDVSASIDLNETTTRLTVTNNFARYTGEKLSIDFADGYDESSLCEFGNIVFIGNVTAEMLRTSPGDMIAVRPGGIFEDTMSRLMISGTPLLQLRTEDEVRELIRGEVELEVDKYTEHFILAGVFSTPSGNYGTAAFTPGSFDSDTLIGVQSMLNAVEYTLRDNLLVDEFREYCTDNISSIASGRTELIIDTSKIDGAKRTLKFLDMLNPIITAAALSIGIVLCSIITLQSSKEAALMRVLGTSRVLTGALLSLEQTLLTVAGLALGALGLLVIDGLGNRALTADNIVRTANTIFNGNERLASLWGAIRPGVPFSLLYIATILASAAICSAIAMRRSVITLLQTKE